MANLVEITVKARDEATAAVARISRTISQQLSGLRRDLERVSQPTTIPIRLQITPARALDELRRDLERVAQTVTAHVRVAVGDRRELDELRRELDRIRMLHTALLRVQVIGREALDELSDLLDEIRHNIIVARIRVDIDSIERVRELRRELERIDRNIRVRIRVSGDRGLFGGGAGDGGGGLSGLLGGLRLLPALTETGAAGLARLAASASAAGAALITAAPALISAGKEIGAIGKAALGAVPALTAWGVAGGLVALTLKEIFNESNAMRGALNSLSEGFSKAGGNASRAAAEGIKPLAEAFNQVMWPELNHMMVRIGTSVNRISKEFLAWAKSAEGMQTVNNILHPIWQSVERLEPSINRLVRSFTEMLGRIMGVSMAAGSNGLAGVFERLADKMDAVDAETVTSAFDKLTSTFNAVKTAVSTVTEWIGKAVNAYKTYQTEFGALADALSIVAIAFGGPMTALAGAASLVIRHFDGIKGAVQNALNVLRETPAGMAVLASVKSAAEQIGPAIERVFTSIGEAVNSVIEALRTPTGQTILTRLSELIDQLAPAIVAGLDGIGRAIKGVVDYFTRSPEGTNFLKDLYSAAETVIPDIIAAFNQIQEKVIPVLENIVTKIREDVIPAFGQFVEAIAPVVSWLVEKFGPYVAEFFSNLAEAISGVLDIISGVFKAIKGLIEGDWAQIWEGAKQAFLGWVEAIGSILDQVLETYTMFFGTLGEAVLSALEKGWELLKEGVSSLVEKLVGWFKDALGIASPSRVFMEIGASIVEGLVEGLTTAWEAVAAWFAELPTKIKDFFADAGSWLLDAGGSVIQGLWDGLQEIWEQVSAWFVETTTVTIPGFFAGAVSWLPSAGREIITGLWNGLQEIWEQVASWFGELKGKIEGFFAGAGSWLVERGKDIIRGLVSGISSMAGEVTSAVGRVIESARSAVSGAARTVLGVLPGFAAGGVAGGLGMASGGVSGPGRRAGRAAEGGARGALTWVGERGRELVRLPYGSRVFPAGTSEVIARRRGLAAAAGGVSIGPVDIHITVNGGGGAAELAALVRSEVEGALGQVARQIRAGVGRR